MTLGFSTTWPKHMPPHMAGKPTEFVDQIWNCLKFDDTFDFQHSFDVWAGFMDLYFLEHKTTFPFLDRDVLEHRKKTEFREKKHTFREDPKDLWKAGRDIHFVINNRTKQRFQFAPVVKCVSVQKIEILWGNAIPAPYKIQIPTPASSVMVFIDKRPLHANEFEALAKNDGFNSVEDFFSWFNKDFTGKIIHWTNLKY